MMPIECDALKLKTDTLCMPDKMFASGNGLRARFIVMAAWLSFTLVGGGTAVAADNSKLWAALKDGKAFAILRHALAPGFSDPSHFKIGDCSTQRNLSDKGRAQARSIGARFRANGITAADVVTSQWCRCQDTATLLGLGEVKALPPLNSFFEARERGESQTNDLKVWLTKRRSLRPLILVTHQVNISALTGAFTRSGETVVARLNSSGKIEVLGSFE